MVRKCITRQNICKSILHAIFLFFIPQVNEMVEKIRIIVYKKFYVKHCGHWLFVSSLGGAQAADDGGWMLFDENSILVIISILQHKINVKWQFATAGKSWTQHPKPT